MSPRLPNLRPREAVNAFLKNGFSIVGQKASHVRLINSTGIQLIIPLHSTDLKRPLLKALIKHAQMSEDEFRELL